MTPLDHIAIYAVEDGGELVGFSFDSHPGKAEPHRVHTAIDRDNPGAPLLLVGVTNRAEAEAFAAGLAYGIGDDCSYLIRYIAPDLTCVLAEFFNGAPNGVTLDDLRRGSRKAGAA